jgi:RHS repeat-associated protein
LTCRVENSITYKQEYNYENLLSAVKKMSGTCASGTVLETTSFVYDGDGNMVKKVKPDGSKTIYVGGIYEVDKTSGGSVTRTVTYYPVTGAMRINSTLYYILKDHLGSASVVTDASGVTVGEQRYYPYGETRFTSGTIYTDKLFTGQREMTGLGIYHYGARFYSPKTGRFLSPDMIVSNPFNPQDLNRFSYVRNNPLRYVDPTGHAVAEEDDGGVYCTVTHTCPQPPCSTCGGGGGTGGGGGGSGGTGGGGSTGGGTGTGGTGGSGGGGQPLAAPYLNTDYYGLIANTLYTTPTLPPSPFACEWFDCALSAISILASGAIGAFEYYLPEVAAGAFVVDIAVTAIAFFRTVQDYHQGEISVEREWILNGTGVLGAIPIGPFAAFGFAFSVINGMATFSGYPP